MTEVSLYSTTEFKKRTKQNVMTVMKHTVTNRSTGKQATKINR